MIWGPIWLWRRESQCLMQDHREYGVIEDGRGVMTEEMECSPVNEYGKAKLEFFRQAVPVRLVFALGGVENDSHLALLQELGKFLEDDNVRERLLTITSYGELEKLI